MKKSDILLDLFGKEEVQVAHAESEEKEEVKEEIKQGPIEVKHTKKTSKEEDEDDEAIKKILKYGLIGGSLLFLIYFIGKYRNRVKEPNMHDMMMFMMCQTLMQNMQGQNKGTLPPQIVTDDNTKFSTDWSDWYEKNKEKEFAKFGSTGTGSDAKVMNKMHIAENWKVRRDLNGKILDVGKTNEYIR